MTSAGGRARRWAAAGAAAVGVGVVLALSGCTGAKPAGGGSAEPVNGPAAGAPPAEGSSAGTGRSTADTDAKTTEQLRLDQRSLIRTADLSVRVDDVATQARRAQDYARAAGGTVAGDTRSGSGDRARADLVLKVRPDRLEAVLDQLGGLGEELQRTSSTEDVTEQVADVDARVATMQASIGRVRAILARARSIGDVVAVEGELSRRITELESLQARQRALAGQVGQATVTLHLVAKEAPAPPAERRGFLGGLASGWNAFTTAGSWLLTALGAVLPFAVLALVVGLAARWVVRRSRRGAAPSPAAPQPAASGPAAS